MLSKLLLALAPTVTLGIAGLTGGGSPALELKRVELQSATDLLAKAAGNITVAQGPFVPGYPGYRGGGGLIYRYSSYPGLYFAGNRYAAPMNGGSFNGTSFSGAAMTGAYSVPGYPGYRGGGGLIYRYGASPGPFFRAGAYANNVR